MKENQLFPLLYYGIIIVCIMISLRVAVSSRTLSSLLVCALLCAASFFFSHMTIRTEDDSLTVSFGAFHWPRWRFPFNEIVSCEPIRFNPLKDFGGWGIRKGRGMVGLIAKGPAGIKITTQGGKTYVISTSDGPSICGLIRK